MIWAANEAAVYRATGEAVTVSVDHLGVVTSYPDCKVSKRVERRVLDSGAFAEVPFLTAHIPAAAGLPEPVKNSTLTWDGDTYTITSVQDPTGLWVIGATL